jgi:hypothetical protein
MWDPPHFDLLTEKRPRCGTLPRDEAKQAARSRRPRPELRVIKKHEHLRAPTEDCGPAPRASCLLRSELESEKQQEK